MKILSLETSSMGETIAIVKHSLFFGLYRPIRAYTQILPTEEWHYRGKLLNRYYQHKLDKMHMYFRIEEIEDSLDMERSVYSNGV